MMTASPHSTHGGLTGEKQYMTHSLISTATERYPPTLWPTRPNDRTPIDFALEVSEEEDRALKKMVVGLSEIILESVVSKK
jgi:hypothetical protein